MARCTLYLMILMLGLGGCTARGVAQEDGPPPEIRQHLQALQKAYNSGSAEEWEQFAQQHFAPDALAARTPEQRKQFFAQLQQNFGKQISISRVERDGPDAPLQLFIETANKSSAALLLELESARPYRIRGMRIEVGGGHDSGPKLPKPPVKASMSAAELSREVDEYVGKLTADGVFSGALLVARDGAPVFQKGYGFADRANQVPNTVETRFNLGSINKKFTEIAIRQLAAEGKLALSDTIGKLLPDYAQAVTRTATVEQLLNFQAGVADFFGPQFSEANKGRFRSNQDYYKLVSSLPPLFAPGERTQYCNGCYIVLGAIIERVSGIPYEQYVEQNIFRPAGMKASAWYQTDAIVPNLAMGYTRRAAGDELRSNFLMRGAAGSAAGGGYSTLGDLLAFLNALKAGEIPHASAPDGGLAIAGGAPGTSAVIDQKGPWTVIVLSNFDPRAGEDLGVALANALGAQE